MEHHRKLKLHKHYFKLTTREKNIFYIIKYFLRTIFILGLLKLTKHHVRYKINKKNSKLSVNFLCISSKVFLLAISVTIK